MIRSASDCEAQAASKTLEVRRYIHRAGEEERRTETQRMRGQAPRDSLGSSVGLRISSPKFSAQSCRPACLSRTFKSEALTQDPKAAPAHGPASVLSFGNDRLAMQGA